MAKLVSKTYGDALFEVALESGKLDVYWEEVKAVRAAMVENPELFKLMSHPKIVKEQESSRAFLREKFPESLWACSE